MKKLSAVLFGISGFALIFAVLITSIIVFAGSEDFYASEYAKLGQAKVIGISDGDLISVTENLLDYTKGERETLDMQFEINGELREVFNEREKAHMVDVRALFLGAQTVQYIAYGVAVLCFTGGFFAAKQGFLRRAALAFLVMCIFFLVFICIVAFWASTDFYSFWNFFHTVFFTNDLWVLDPATDLMILMVPSQFFSDLVGSIVALFSSLYAAIVIACAAIVIAGRKKASKCAR